MQKRRLCTGFEMAALEPSSLGDSLERGGAEWKTVPPGWRLGQMHTVDQRSHPRPVKRIPID